MSYSQTVKAIEVGLDVVAAEITQRLDLVAIGDMDIGNTTPSSAIVAAITGYPAARVTGRGTGVDDAGLARKVAVIERALAVNQPNARNPLDVLMKVGGLEITALVGVMLRAGAGTGAVPALLLLFWLTLMVPESQASPMLSVLGPLSAAAEVLAISLSLWNVIGAPFETSGQLSCRFE